MIKFLMDHFIYWHKIISKNNHIQRLMAPIQELGLKYPK